MIETLLLPFQFPFMLAAFAITGMVAVPAAVLSCFLVLKGWSLMGDAISHAVLPGVIAAYILGVPLVAGAFAAGMFCAVATGFLNENSRVKEDTVMGVVFSGMFGLGIVLYSWVRTEVHLDHILFGDPLGAVDSDLWLTGTIGLAVASLAWAKRRDLLLLIFDEGQARALGLRTGWLHYGLLALLSLTVVAALKAVGLILAIAFLISPGATAFLVTRRFDAMIGVAVLVSAASSFAGVYASFFLNSAPAPTIVLAMTACFVIAFAASARRARRAEREVGNGWQIRDRA